MHQKQLAKLLLRPSLFSFILTMLFAGAILAIAVWPDATHSSLLNQYFYGPYGVVQALKKSPDINEFTRAFSVSPVVYYGLILGVAALIAGGVYAILQMLSKVIVGSYDTWHVFHDPIEGKEKIEKEVGTRLTVRLMTALLWIAFAYFFMTILLPYCIFASRIGISHLFEWEGLYALAGFLLLIASLHVHVIFLRLILLRPRVFGGKLDIMAALYEAEENKE